MDLLLFLFTELGKPGIEAMRKLIFRGLCLGLIFAVCFMAARAYPSSMDMFMELFLGPRGGSVESCDAGYSLAVDTNSDLAVDTGGGYGCAAD